jgi:hypothetical protein
MNGLPSSHAAEQAAWHTERPPRPKRHLLDFAVNIGCDALLALKGPTLPLAVRVASTRNAEPTAVKWGMLGPPGMACQHASAARRCVFGPEGPRRGYWSRVEGSPASFRGSPAAGSTLVDVGGAKLTYGIESLHRASR